MPTLSLLTTCLLIAAPAAAKPTLVVAPLQSHKRDKENADTLGEMIRIHVGKSKHYTLVTPEDMGSIDAELKRQLAGGCDEASCIAEIGGALGARFMITGKLKRMGKRYILLLKLVDIEQVKATNTESIQAKSPEMLLDLLESKIAVLLGAQLVANTSNRSRGPVIQGGEITAALGWLNITGKPAGALVQLAGPSGFIKRVQLPKGKPWMQQVPPGRYTWVATRAGYEADRGHVTVKTDQTAVANIALKTPGTLHITGRPNGAKVEIKGPVTATRGLPIRINRAPAGRYRITVSRAGYKTITQSVTLAPGQSRTLRLALTPADAPSSQAAQKAKFPVKRAKRSSGISIPKGFFPGYGIGAGATMVTAVVIGVAVDEPVAATVFGVLAAVLVGLVTGAINAAR